MTQVTKQNANNQYLIYLAFTILIHSRHDVDQVYNTYIQFECLLPGAVPLGDQDQDFNFSHFFVMIVFN